MLPWSLQPTERFYFYNHTSTSEDEDEATVWELPVVENLSELRESTTAKKKAFKAQVKEDRKKHFQQQQQQQQGNGGCGGGGGQSAAASPSSHRIINRSPLQIAQEEAAAREASLMEAQAEILANVKKLVETVSRERGI